jgi:hypothetical protein
MLTDPIRCEGGLTLQSKPLRWPPFTPNRLIVWFQRASPVGGSRAASLPCSLHPIALPEAVVR